MLNIRAHSLFLVILLAQLSPVTQARLVHPIIIFTYQSAGISLTQWIELFTLCLAPLIAHVAGGAPSPTILRPRTEAPHWTARLPHFNPISIIWRYYAIADRRARARKWCEQDMAACSAVFWDGERRRWDGSEA